MFDIRKPRMSLARTFLLNSRKDVVFILQKIRLRSFLIFAQWRAHREKSSKLAGPLRINLDLITGMMGKIK